MTDTATLQAALSDYFAPWVQALHLQVEPVQPEGAVLLRLPHSDQLIHARVLRAGKTMAFGEIDLSSAADGKSVCRASTTYALL